MLLDLVFPRRCVVCGADGAVLCGRCEAGLQRLARPAAASAAALRRRGPSSAAASAQAGEIAFARARAAVAYDDSAKRLVGAWKERGQSKLAEIAAELVDAAVARPSAYTLTFVPADENRLLGRGHNPAQRLAVELGARWQLPVVPLLSARARQRARRRA